MTQLPYLTDAEVLAMCEPLTQPAAICRFLGRLGLKVVTKPNGRPLVLRTELARVLAANPQESGQSVATAGPNVTGLQDYFKRGKKHGTSA